MTLSARSLFYYIESAKCVGVEVPHWMLKCPLCSAEFPHSEVVRMLTVSDFCFPRKRDFPTESTTPTFCKWSLPRSCWKQRLWVPKRNSVL